LLPIWLMRLSKTSGADDSCGTTVKPSRIGKPLSAAASITRERSLPVVCSTATGSPAKNFASRSARTALPRSVKGLGVATTRSRPGLPRSTSRAKPWAAAAMRAPGTAACSAAMRGVA
jgi:hypothetical protein